MVRIILLCDVYIIWCFIVPPNITIPVEGQEFTITEGSNGSITCTATGYPPPTVVWQNIDSNDRLMSGTPIISPIGVGNVTSVSVELMVTGVMRVDTGMYTCSASNILGSDTTTVNITVQCKSFVICILFNNIVLMITSTHSAIWFLLINKCLNH